MRVTESLLHPLQGDIEILAAQSMRNQGRVPTARIGIRKTRIVNAFRVDMSSNERLFFRTQIFVNPVCAILIEFRSGKMAECTLCLYGIDHSVRGDLSDWSRHRHQDSRRLMPTLKRAMAFCFTILVLRIRNQLHRPNQAL